MPQHREDALAELDGALVFHARSTLREDVTRVNLQHALPRALSGLIQLRRAASIETAATPKLVTQGMTARAMRRRRSAGRARRPIAPEAGNEVRRALSNILHERVSNVSCRVPFFRREGRSDAPEGCVRGN